MKKHYTLLGWLGIISALIVVACSPAASTTPPTRTPIPTFSFTQPTEAPQVATVAAATASAGGGQTASSEDIAQGKARYEALECGSCHGKNGEGTDEGPALAGTSLIVDEFVDFLRTGGTIGNDHLYSANRLSEKSARNIYYFVQSLAGGSQ